MHFPKFTFLIPRERRLIGALLARRPVRATPWRLLAVAAMLLGIGALHHLGGQSIGLYTFFILPCMFAGWFIGRAAVALTAALSAGIALASDSMTHAGTPFVFLAVNASLRFCLYALAGWGAHAIGRLIERLEEMSRTDALTGLANRREFLARGEEEIRRARRSGRPFSILFADIDNFKAVNDKLGHAAGDVLLSRVGRVMRRHLRALDIPARLGGDEFAALLPETDGRGAHRIALKLHAELKAEFAKVRRGVSASIGAATCTTPPGSFDDAVKFADGLMYSIKRKTKNAVVQADFPSPGP